MKGGESNEETHYSIYRYSVCTFYDRPLLRSGSGYRTRTGTRKEDGREREEGREEEGKEGQEGQEGKEGREEGGREEDGRTKEITVFNLVFAKIIQKGFMRNHEPLLLFWIRPVFQTTDERHKIIVLISCSRTIV